jgi:hypothetical protein
MIHRRLMERAGVELHQAAVAVLIGRQENDPRRCKRITRRRVLIAEIDRHGAAGNRLDAVARNLVGKLQRAEHVVIVGQRQRRLMVRLGQFHQLGDGDRTLQ